MVVPAGLSFAVGTGPVLIGLVVSAVLVAAGAYVVIPWATATGLPVSVFSRRLFGYFGAAFATLVLAATGIYFAAFEGSVIAVAFHQYFGGLSLNLWYLVVVLIAVPLMIGGVRVWLDRLNGVLLPLYLLGLIGAIVWAIAEYGYHGGWFTFKPPHPLDTHGPAWVFVLGAYIAQPTLLFAWEYARLGRREDVTVNRRITFGLPFWLATFFVNGLIGIFLVHTIKVPGEVSEVTLVLALVSLMGLAGVAFIWVTQTRINTANFYVASTNLQGFTARVFKLELPRAVWVVIAGAMVYGLMLADLFSFLLEALRYQGAFVTGWLVILVAHTVIARRSGEDPRQIEFRPGRLPQINLVGFLPWVIGGTVGVVLLAGETAFANTWALPMTRGSRSCCSWERARSRPRAGRRWRGRTIPTRRSTIPGARASAAAPADTCISPPRLTATPARVSGRCARSARPRARACTMPRISRHGHIEHRSTAPDATVRSAPRRRPQELARRSHARPGRTTSEGVHHG